MQTRHCKRSIANEELQTKRLPGYATVRQAVDIRAIQLVDEFRPDAVNQLDCCSDSAMFGMLHIASTVSNIPLNSGRHLLVTFD